MAERKTIKDLGCEVIEDFLMATRTRVETRNSDPLCDSDIDIYDITSYSMAS